MQLLIRYRRYCLTAATLVLQFLHSFLPSSMTFLSFRSKVWVVNASAGVDYPIVNFFLHFYSLGISIMISTFFNKLLWYEARATLISGYKERYLKYSWELNQFKKMALFSPWQGPWSHQSWVAGYVCNTRCKFSSVALFLSLIMWLFATLRHKYYCTFMSIFPSCLWL